MLIMRSAGDTIRAKRNFERLVFNHGVIVRKYRADNGVFNSAEFEVEIGKGLQSITYSGVGAQHQNGVAKRAIRTVVEQAHSDEESGACGCSVVAICDDALVSLMEHCAEVESVFST